MDDLKGEADRLQILCRKQQEEIESLNEMADAVEALRDIGKQTGCDHVDGPDGRRQLVNCVEQTIDKLQSENDRFRVLLADSALYVARMAKIVESYNHPSRIHRRAMAFYEKELRQFARTIHALGADKQ